MKHEDVVITLISMLQEIQREVCEDVQEIYASTCPIDEIGGFDSLMGVVVTARCFDLFDIKNDNTTVSLFEQKKYGEPLTINEVANRIISLKRKECKK